MNFALKKKKKSANKHEAFMLEFKSVQNYSEYTAKHFIEISVSNLQ